MFIHVPRTAGDSLQRLLVPLSDDFLVPRPELVASPDGGDSDDFEVQGPHTPRKHTTAAEYRDELGAEQFARLFKFATVRNPWERAVSWYFGPHNWPPRRGAPYWSPDGFTKRIRRLVPIASLVCIDGELAVDKVLRFERLDEDVSALLVRLGIDAELPRMNKRWAAHEPWERYYAESPELVDVVRERFGEDAELFGYDPPAV